jgi:hypothetical protein
MLQHVSRPKAQLTLSGQSMRLSNSDLGVSLDFLNCPRLAADMVSVLRGWNCEVQPVPRKPNATLTIEKKRTRFHWHSRKLAPSDVWLRHPPHTSFSVLCELHYDWSDWFVARNPGYLCLHSAAARFGSGAVLFPCDQKAGKSVLTMQLAEAGHEVFGDDVVALTPRGNRAMSLGLLPRLRLPYPTGSTQSFCDFVAARSGPSNEHYQFVALRDGEFAPFGASAPVSAIVLLERVSDGPAEFTDIETGEVVKQLIRKNFAEAMPVADIFARLHTLARRVPKLRLRYSKGADAIAMLRKTFL